MPKIYNVGWPLTVMLGSNFNSFSLFRSSADLSSYTLWGARYLTTQNHQHMRAQP
jgi:hypothetical protein